MTWMQKKRDGAKYAPSPMSSEVAHLKTRLSNTLTENLVVLEEQKLCVQQLQQLQLEKDEDLYEYMWLERKLEDALEVPRHLELEKKELEFRNAELARRLEEVERSLGEAKAETELVVSCLNPESKNLITEVIVAKGQIPAGDIVQGVETKRQERLVQIATSTNDHMQTQTEGEGLALQNEMDALQRQVNVLEYQLDDAREDLVLSRRCLDPQAQDIFRGIVAEKGKLPAKDLLAIYEEKEAQRRADLWGQAKAPKTSEISTQVWPNAISNQARPQISDGQKRRVNNKRSNILSKAQAPSTTEAGMTSIFGRLRAVKKETEPGSQLMESVRTEAKFVDRNESTANARALEESLDSSASSMKEDQAELSPESLDLLLPCESANRSVFGRRRKSSKGPRLRMPPTQETVGVVGAKGDTILIPILDLDKLAARRENRAPSRGPEEPIPHQEQFKQSEEYLRNYSRSRNHSPLPNSRAHTPHINSRVHSPNPKRAHTPNPNSRARTPNPSHSPSHSRTHNYFNTRHPSTSHPTAQHTPMESKQAVHSRFGLKPYSPQANSPLESFSLSKGTNEEFNTGRTTGPQPRRVSMQTGTKGNLGSLPRPLYDSPLPYGRRGSTRESELSQWSPGPSRGGVTDSRVSTALGKFRPLDGLSRPDSGFERIGGGGGHIPLLDWCSGKEVGSPATPFGQEHNKAPFGQDYKAPGDVILTNFEARSTPTPTNAKQQAAAASTRIPVPYLEKKVLAAKKMAQLQYSGPPGLSVLPTLIS